MSVILEARRLTKAYGNNFALHEMNLQVEAGEIFCLLGQNGAGKTTTINLFLGFVEPTSGEAVVRDKRVHADPHIARKYLSYIPEVVQLYANLSGLENLDFFSRLAGFKYKQQQLAEFLTKAGLQETAFTQNLGRYSKGMRQKVGIAIALAKNADVIFMDEPTSGLDPKATDEFTTICKELAQNGKTLFMATHDIFNAVSTGHRIGIMKAGALVFTTPTKGITPAQMQQLYLETI